MTDLLRRKIIDNNKNLSKNQKYLRRCDSRRRNTSEKNTRKILNSKYIFLMRTEFDTNSVHTYAYLRLKTLQLSFANKLYRESSSPLTPFVGCST